MDICEMCQRHNTFLFCDDCDELSNFVIKPVYRAAPEMYEVLKEINENCARCPICHNTKGNGHDYTCKLGNALSKAEGSEE